MDDETRSAPAPQAASGLEVEERDAPDVGHPDAPIRQAGNQLDFDEDDSDTPLPRFMEEEGAWKRWKWVPYPLRRAGRAVAKWAKGPPSPRDHKITPILPAVQQAPLVLLAKYLPRKQHQICLYMAYVVVWILTFCLVMRHGLQTSEVPGYGEPTDISCGATYWVAGNQCGVDGNACRPFTNSSFAFRCPANCASYIVLNPRAVGTQEVVYKPLLVGGPSDVSDEAVYRGDSFICGSAIHAGVISNTGGGCGVVSLVGSQQNYTGTVRNGMTSVGFDSYFPSSFTFAEGITCKARDVRWPLLGVSVAFTTVLSLFTDSAGLFFFSVFIGIFWQVGMASDPPNHSSIAGLFTNILGKFVPAMFCAWVFYDKMGVRRTLKGLSAHIEKTVLWLGACWVGALTNYTFDFIPIQRLTGHDLEQQPGAKAALAMIILVLVAVVVSQVWFFQQEGRLLKYLKLYTLFVAGIIVCLVLPDMSLRIHHYVLALLLLPGTSMQTRPSLLYQGLLVGFFINGIARWGFDPFLQTTLALQGDAQVNSPLPVISSAISTDTNSSTITFQWEGPPGPRYDGISVLVNDVERFRSYFDDANHPESFAWPRNDSFSANEYFRFGYLGGASAFDYTKAGVWDAQGRWNDMAAGPSKVKSRSLDGEVRVPAF